MSAHVDDDVRAAARERTVFVADGERFTWSDVIGASRLRGAWLGLEDGLRCGIACQRRLAASGEALDAKELIEATTSFRYARNLLSGDDLAEWLARWRITGAEWRDHVSRELLNERWGDELDDTVSRFPVLDGEVAAAAWPEAACSGFLEVAARRLAGDVALAIGEGVPIEGDRALALTRILAAADWSRAACITDDAVEREVASHRLDWLRVEAMTLVLPTGDVAQEAILSIRGDGRSLAAVASDCGVAPGALDVLIGDVEGDLSSLLLAAREGDVLGPIPRDDGFAVMRIERKTAPNAADPAMRTRAAKRLLSRAVEQATNRCVTWHESL